MSFADSAREEAVLAQIHVEAAQTAIPHAHDGEGLAGVALGLVKEKEKKCKRLRKD